MWRKKGWRRRSRKFKVLGSAAALFLHFLFLEPFTYQPIREGGGALLKCLRLIVGVGRREADMLMYAYILESETFSRFKCKSQ